jgi:hypothetical protein
VEIEMLVVDEGSDEWLARTGLTRAQYEELNECQRQRVNPQFLNCSGPKAEQEAMARRYWRSEETDAHVLTEVLFFGFFRVVRILDP